MAFNEKELQAKLTELIHRTTCVLPEASLKALQEAYDREADGSIAKIHLETNLKNQLLSRERSIPLCADTGIPCYFVRIGKVANLDLVSLEQSMVDAVIEATSLSYIRPTVVDPLSRSNPGNNVGYGSPVIKYKVDPELDCCEIIYAPKGGGTEIFGPAFRTILASDGIKGIKKFVFDSIIIDGNKTGATCAPNIIGVGVGGTSDNCMSLAKQAACLRKVGSRNPDQRVSNLEDELMEALNSMNLGPLGMGGGTTVLDVHIEMSLTHLVGTPLAVVVQCPAARVGVLRVYQDGSITAADWPGWFKY